MRKGEITVVTQAQIEKIQQQLDNLFNQHWFHDNLFTWQWWVLLGLAIIPWIIWWKVVDQNRKQEILLFGFFTALVASFIDVYGWDHYTWTYPILLLPMCTPIFPMDYAVIPVLHMLIYQRFRTWKSFFLAELTIAVLFAYGGEALLIWMGIYKPIIWKHIYSILPYVGKALLGKWLVEKLKSPTP